MRILIVEDERPLAEMLKLGLEKLGYTADYVTDGEAAERRILLYKKEYDLVILDWMMPARDGLEICQNVRAQKVKIPIIMLTAKFETADKITALNAGADDYLSKPFSFDELAARIHALLRRPAEPLEDVLEAQGVKLNSLKRTVFVDEREVKLTAKEFALLEYLLRNADIVVSRDQILDHLWGFDFDSFTNVVDVHMKNLRTKLEDRGYSAIETIRGVGYRIKAA